MKNVIYIVLAGSLWGIISIFIQVLNSLGFASMQCVAIRAFFTALILLIYLLIVEPKKLKIKIKDIKYFIGTGIFSIVLFNFCYFESIDLIGGAAIPALLLYTAPIFVMILSAILFHEKITEKKLVALILTFIGLGFVTGAFAGKQEVSIGAFILGLGSGFGYALYSIFGKLVTDKYDAVTITFYTFLIAAVGSIPFSGVINHMDMLINARGMIASLGLAFFSTVLPFLFYTKGLKGIEAGKASILATVEPFVAAIIGAVVFHEIFTVSKVIGMVLIVVAIVYLNVEKG